MDEEKVDILLATYNGEKYLREQLDSILNQSYRNFNLIISDDCSRKETREILKEYESKDDRVKVYYQQENIGSNRNFEYLLSKVKSKYYMFSDQDDVWIEDKIKLSVEKIIETDSDLVFTDLEVVDEKLNKLHSSFNKKMKLIKKIKKYKDYRLEYLYNCITGCTMIAKTSMLEKILPLPNNKDILHDYWIGLVTSLIGKIEYLDVATIKYRQHPKNQVGVSRYTDRFKTFDEKRNYIIDLKIAKFTTYCENKSYFSKELRTLNKEAVEYFSLVKKKKNLNFKNWETYNKIFKYDSFGYYMFYFFMYNFPCIYRLGYNIFNFFKK